MQEHFPKKAVHGGRILALRQNNTGNLLDVSASMNPFVPDVSCDFRNADLCAYPDDSYTALKEKIGRVFSRDTEEICVGNGSAELIRVYCNVVLSRHDTVRIDSPTFSEYDLSARLAGADVISGKDADVRILCNPNNPTGILTPRSEMLSILDDCSKKGCRFFVDEAFMELAARNESISDIRSENLFVMRSITKCFSVPGIRFGFGFGPADLIEEMETARTPWTVNAFAEAYTMSALDHYDELALSAAKISAEREWYFSRLTDLGLHADKSSANYILVHLGRNAAEFTNAMLKHGILVRDCTSFGLPESIRISVETREKNTRVLEALSACLH
ncbi:MAG: histidinol-phosphate aminotransferase family protein [Methanocorpusculum sp.]|jgi:threonine-phosphate decarboxylase|nr:histidinol-phosphate aminotransferase family protein [Methanocorpusculum sp.]MDD2470410.1 histidinol-phosphate transaminase [Methanocorpusculum sp.]MDD3256725.1 histidinol-phosphate transaminase [Methanocorpusculum sp.]MDD4132276.1 histidinol-phosphate transaminase [Methanocorpusculum sp.]